MFTSISFRFLWVQIALDAKNTDYGIRACRRNYFGNPGCANSLLLSCKPYDFVLFFSALCGSPTVLQEESDAKWRPRFTLGVELYQFVGVGTQNTVRVVNLHVVVLQ